MTTPRCEGCGRTLDRIDHLAIEHSILDGDMYMPLGAHQSDAAGTGPGIASEVDLRCSYCGTSIPRAAKEFFYKRWYEMLVATRRISGEPT